VRHGQPGRPVISREVRELIRKMCRENPSWRAPRIHGELLKLGIDIGRAVSANTSWAPANPGLKPGAFLEKHTKQLVSIDFFTVPAIRFEVPYVFLVWPLTDVASCTSMGPLMRPRSGPHSNCGKHFPLPNSRASCSATVTLFLAMTSENT
jgi:hypothetical protein